MYAYIQLHNTLSLIEIVCTWDVGMEMTDGIPWRSYADLVLAGTDPAEADVHVNTIRQGVFQADAIG